MFFITRISKDDELLVMHGDYQCHVHRPWSSEQLLVSYAAPPCKCGFFFETAINIGIDHKKE